MLSISKNELFISHLESATQSYIQPRAIPPCIPRRCDGFVYILSGSCSYRFATHGFTAKAGDILYLACGAVYSMNVHERYDFIVVNFLFDDPRDRKSQVFSPLDGEDAELSFQKLLRRHRKREDGYFGECMSLLYKIYSSAIRSEAGAYMPNSAKYKLERAKDTILQGFQGDIAVSDLAKAAEMSEVYFRKLFRAAYGSSPSEFIINCRIESAKELLRENYLSLSDIAEFCGFSSLSYFCRVFKKSVGITPRAFAEEYYKKSLQ